MVGWLFDSGGTGWKGREWGGGEGGGGRRETFIYSVDSLAVATPCCAPFIQGYKAESFF